MELWKIRKIMNRPSWQDLQQSGEMLNPFASGIYAWSGYFENNSSNREILENGCVEPYGNFNLQSNIT